ncbi:hypothetical protein CRI77_17455 [Mycolicibacterium duvalii]|uniref:Uncharacterized protein n=1 Tax=Mycolicibacterium duvalii TaxID=39688 RepID=A0A7I7K628_9MYCO|nr:hypothetical protein [Mycolicibacterium duvalii]MCV7366169.1 hypothetical protein [Mycolicibacterium duvalii]PEG38823.1 hypothetical protein CRI77_17455 [Mycolicibacterium duvalii]BBX19620.1 hypothetical protein MDUV_44800 [Mycolicibacterium duvalii]
MTTHATFLTRSRSLLLLTLAVVAALVAACTGVEPAPDPTPGTEPSSPFDPTTTTTQPTGPLLAYRAADEIGLVDGTRVVATVKGTFPTSNDLITTEDRRFVFARTEDNRLATLDVVTRRGSIRPVTVGPTLGTSGDSAVVWWEQPDRLMRLDLSDPDAAPQVAQTVALPPAAGVPPGAPRLVVARGGTAVLARVEAPPSPFGGPDTLYAVRGPGPPAPLGQADANSPVTVARLSPDGAELAYALYRAVDGACGTAAVVQSKADGTQETFEVAGADPAAGSRVTRLWWPTEGLPELSLSTWHCGAPPSAPPLVWQVVDSTIAQLSPPTSALQTAELEPGKRALLLPNTDDYAAPAGTLVYEDGGRRFPVREDVDGIAVIPPAP